MEWSKGQIKAQEQMNAIITKCWEDKNFKQELLANPIETIEKFNGSKLNIPEGIKLIVNDQTDPSEYHFNIPIRPGFDSTELTDEQLEAVAGGAVDPKNFAGNPIGYGAACLIECIIEQEEC